ncbi:MAG: M28 family peptidase [Planctomycetes bacterium]|nr:M28 family peptidase [Planctomycetota bacterium]
MKTIEVSLPIRLPVTLPIQQHILLWVMIFSCFALAWRVDGGVASPPTVPPDSENSTLPSAQRQPVAAQVGAPPRFDGRRAYQYLRTICSFGNRMSGSPGMRKQQRLLEKHFVELGGQFEYQRFPGKINPRTGKKAPMANLIVRWNPEATERILLCAHYDTRPFPNLDRNPRLAREGVFLGANDGASGVAVLMELAHHVDSLTHRYGLDFVLFDAEEFIFDERRDRFFLGSEWFARHYRDHPPKYRYVAGVLLDMVGDAKLSVYQERFSATWPDTRPLVQEIWGTAERLGIREFIPRIGYEVRDDHVPLHQIAKIPVIDVIDYQYPDRRNSYWHTTADAPGRCSADSLGKVGLVIQEWLKTKP